MHNSTQHGHKTVTIVKWPAERIENHRPQTCIFLKMISPVNPPPEKMWNVKRKCYSPKGSRRHHQMVKRKPHYKARLYNNKYTAAADNQQVVTSKGMTIFAAATCKGSVCRLFFPINNMPTIIIIRFELTRPVHLSAFRGNQFKNKNAAVRKLSARRSKKKCPAPWIFFFLKKEEKERKLLCLLLTDWLLLSVACGQCRQWTLKFYFIYIKFSFFLLYVCLSGGVDDESVYIFVVVSPDTFFFREG
jgi:hypothetical protein